MNISDFDFDLPEEYISQTPVEPRDASRLMVLDRSRGGIEHTHFFDLPRFLRPGDVLVLNETRVLPARLFASKIPGGGKVEILAPPATIREGLGSPGRGKRAGRRKTGSC